MSLSKCEKVTASQELKHEKHEPNKPAFFIQVLLLRDMLGATASPSAPLVAMGMVGVLPAYETWLSSRKTGIHQCDLVKEALPSLKHESGFASLRSWFALDCVLADLVITDSLHATHRGPVTQYARGKSDADPSGGVLAADPYLPT